MKRGFHIIHLKVIHVTFGDVFEKVARLIAQKKDEAHVYYLCLYTCMYIVRLCAIAVDFTKIGVIVVLPANLRLAKYPDFMKKIEKPQYILERILGKLFGKVMEAGMDKEISSFTKREAIECYDKQMEFDGFKNYKEASIAL